METQNHLPPLELSERDKTILKMICDEKTTKEIAIEMELSPRTIEACRDKLRQRIGARSVVGLVRYAYREKIAS